LARGESLSFALPGEFFRREFGAIRFNIPRGIARDLSSRPRTPDGRRR
jgi:hypothetical protein